MITLRCANCGAPLEVEDNASLAKCKYCGATTRVRDRTLQMAATPLVPQATPSAPVIYEPPRATDGPSMGRPRAVARRRRGCAPVIASLVGVAAISGAVAALSATNESGGGGGFLAGLAALAPAPVTEACLVDANGDGVLDVAALRSSGGTSFAEIRDGSSGESRWRGDAVPSATKFVCVGHHIVLGFADFTTRIHDARSPSTPLLVRGADVTETVRQGTGCLDLEAADHSHLAVAVDGSNATQCQPEAAARGDDDRGIMGLTDEVVTLREGDDLLRLSAREQGTPMLSVRPNAGTGEHLTPLMKCTFSAALAASPTAIFVQGCPIGSEKAALVLALRRTDLAELWRAPIAGGTEWDVDLFVWNGHALLVRASGGIYAIDGATGATLWSIR